MDGFHHPREIRYRRGSLSPEGYYRDAFDYDAVHAQLLEPLGPGGDRRYRTATALIRDAELFGGTDAVRQRYRLRYLPAQELYRAEASPAQRADVVIDNDDPGPRVSKWPSA